jgi:hypothetical protein
MSHVTRTTVDLSDQPDLVVIYLGKRVRTLRGMRTLRAIERERSSTPLQTSPTGCSGRARLWIDTERLLHDPDCF